MKIRPVGAELSHMDAQTDQHHEIDSRFSHSCESAQNMDEKVIDCSRFHELISGIKATRDMSVEKQS